LLGEIATLAALGERHELVPREETAHHEAGITVKESVLKNI